MRHAMGVAVFSGMIGVTLFGLFLTPVFYTLVRALSGNRPLRKSGEHPADAPTATVTQLHAQPLLPGLEAAE
jgi:multidrug efflux pump